MKKENVVGVGIGYKQVNREKTDTESIVILVEKKLPPTALREKDVIQRELEGFPTDVQEIGRIEALTLKTGRVRTERWRPAPGGVSIGHYRVSSGTLGAPVYDKRSGEKLILSNSHILAHNNDARIGDPILQPGPFDGGRKRDEIAQLHQFVPLLFSVDTPGFSLASGAAGVANTLFRIAGSPYRLLPVRICSEKNVVDAAVALPATERSIKDEILDIGTLEGTIPAELGMVVEKSSRTTGHNTGTVDVVEATVVVHYEYQRTAVFSHQGVVRLLARGGDSGSVIVSENKAVGLLFAGSGHSSICNPMDKVLDALTVEI